MIFDRSRGQCWKGRKAPRRVADEQELGNFAKLQDIACLQIITKVVPGGETPYNSYELNVVLNDGPRFNAVDHGDKESLKEDARTLAEFLGVVLEEE